MRLFPRWMKPAAPPAEPEPLAPEPPAVSSEAFPLTHDELMAALKGLGDIPPEVWAWHMADVVRTVDELLAQQGIDPAEADHMTPQEFYRPS